MPTRLRRSVTSRLGSWMSVPPIRMFPSIRTPSTRSFMRLRQRRSVDLPHPDGPMYAVTRCFGMDIEMSLRAILAPYQSDRWSISTMGISMMGPGLPPGFRLDDTLNTDPDIDPSSGWSHRRRRVAATQPVAHADREQVQDHHDHEQQQRGGEDHRPRRVYVGRLEPHVVDVEAQ